MKRDRLAWVFYLPSTGVFLYFLLAVIMLVSSSEGAVILGNRVPAQELLVIELPPLAFGFLSLAFVVRRARFFAMFSLGASLMMFASQRPDIPLFQYVALLPFFGAGAISPVENQPLSLNERVVNTFIAAASVLTFVHFRTSITGTLGAAYWVPILLCALGVLLLIAKNRVLSAAGLPPIAGFFGVLLYVLYPAYVYPLVASLLLAFYTFVPLKKLVG
jgi:hypothetical protein